MNFTNNFLKTKTNIKCYIVLKYTCKRLKKSGKIKAKGIVTLQSQPKVTFKNNDLKAVVKSKYNDKNKNTNNSITNTSTGCIMEFKLISS